jgi:hypothetical protein
MLIEVPVYWYPDGFDQEQDDDLKITRDLKQGVLTVETNHICAFNPHDNGNTMIRLSNGEVFEVLVKYKIFKGIMEGVTEDMNVLISGTN